MSAFLALFAEAGAGFAEAQLARQTIHRQVAAEQHRALLRAMPPR